MKSTFETVLLTSFLSTLAACNSTKNNFNGQCSSNDQCGVGAYCKNGLCACRSDEACPSGEVCNSQGVCQTRSACRSNAECTAPEFCDLASGNCLDPRACGTDAHCDPGSVCENAVCTQGCYSDSDCPLYASCQGGSAGVRGNCIAGRCSDKTFCPYGQDCGSSNMCVQDTNQWHCADCTTDRSCGDPHNYCLVNSAYDPNDPSSGTQSFCGVECHNESDCPSGYQCGSVVLLTQDQCTNDNECGGGGRKCVIGEGNLRGFCTCVADQDCTIDQVPATCLTGRCGGFGTWCSDNSQCISGNCQHVAQGQCQFPQGQSCTSDSQCQTQSLCQQGGFGNVCITDGVTQCRSSADCLCMSSGLGGDRVCFGSGRPCNTAADCNLACKEGGCVLGNACAPLQGLGCPDVR